MGKVIKENKVAEVKNESHYCRWIWCTLGCDSSDLWLEEEHLLHDTIQGGGGSAVRQLQTIISVFRPGPPQRQSSLDLDFGLLIQLLSLQSRLQSSNSEFGPLTSTWSPHSNFGLPILLIRFSCCSAEKLAAASTSSHAGSAAKQRHSHSGFVLALKQSSTCVWLPCSADNLDRVISALRRCKINIRALLAAAKWWKCFECSLKTQDDSISDITHSY